MQGDSSARTTLPNVMTGSAWGCAHSLVSYQAGSRVILSTTLDKDTHRVARGGCIFSLCCFSAGRTAGTLLRGSAAFVFTLVIPLFCSNRNMRVLCVARTSHKVPPRSLCTFHCFLFSRSCSHGLQYFCVVQRVCNILFVPVVSYSPVVLHLL